MPDKTTSSDSRTAQNSTESSQSVLINIGRQLGSGGRIIAQQLANEFGCTFYDREILNLAAQESGFSEEFFEQADEHKGFFRSLLQHPGRSIATGNFYHSQFSEESLFQFQSDAIRKAAAQGSCVFVGRCADYVLRDFANCVNIFVTAHIDDRISRVQERHRCSADEARHIIEKGEARRASFYNYYTGKRWGQAESYDLCVNSSLLGTDETARFVADFIRSRLAKAPSGDTITAR